ncbi:cell division protein FtsQ/DivIB [Treponema pectinovorum]|uniref:cell division protein FtsQ/DivIB n=1 Tax=Treponema pectinovorum TaxID=164 RepID=UPI0011F1E414|nr:FtsQ-type POTRA domain-containing protein [Treponema pectinovorum]
MSDVIFDRFGNFEGISKSKSKKRKTDLKGKALVVLVSILICILFVEMFLYFFAFPSFETVKITFSGLKNFSQQEVVKACGGELEKNYFKIDKIKIKSLISSIAGIENVSVKLRFPNRVFIDIEERQAVAVTFINDSERTIPIQIDRNGVLFPVKSAFIPSDGSVPIISGIPVENIPEGMRLPSKYHLLLDQIYKIQSVNRKYFAAVSEIRVVPREYGNFELVLIPVKAHLKVLADRILNEETLQKMMVTLDVVKGLDPNVDVIDLRYGSVSYHSRGVNTGVLFE